MRISFDVRSEESETEFGNRANRKFIAKKQKGD